MTNFSWYGYEAQVDLETTRSYYAHAPDWDCICGHCRNFVALARERKLPQELLAILDSLSIPPEKATYVCELCYDKDWRENTRMILPVHDEMNLEVSIPYMREAWLKMRKVMNFSPENFSVPIIIDTGVGTSWGNCLDVECISPKGRVVPKDIDPDDFSGEERAYLQEILEECVFEELPDRLKKFVKC